MSDGNRSPIFAVRTARLSSMNVLTLLRELMLQLQYVSQPFFMCLTFVLLFDRFAAAMGMIDRPTERKRHVGVVPLVGGPALYLAISLSIVLFIPHTITTVFILIGLVLVVLGVVDDRFDIPVRIRLIVQGLVAYLTVAYAGVQINQVGNLVGMGVFEFGGAVSFVFTVIAIIGVINAVNMIDGLDGLAGSILMVTFVGLGFLCLQAGYTVGMRMNMIFVGALIGFLCFNARVFVPKARVFMGDSGSMLMGYILAWFFISLTQVDSPPMSSIVAVWMFGLPLVDTLSVMIRRARARISPFSAGRDHMHYLLVDNGFSVNETVATLVVVHAIFVGVGVAANGREWLEPFLFVAFVLVTVAYYLFAPRLANDAARRWQREAPRQKPDSPSE